MLLLSTEAESQGKMQQKKGKTKKFRQRRTWDTLLITFLLSQWKTTGQNNPVPWKKLKRHELQQLPKFGQESYWSDQLQFETKLFAPPILFSNILCNVKLRSDKVHINSVLASENHEFTTTLCLFTYCLIKCFPLKVHLRNL